MDDYELNRSDDESSNESLESEEKSTIIPSTTLQTTIINKNQTHNDSETTPTSVIKTTIEDKINTIISTTEADEEEIKSYESEDESSNEPESNPLTNLIKTTNIISKSIPIQTTTPLKPTTIKIQTTIPLKPTQIQTTLPLKPDKIQTTTPLKPTIIHIKTIINVTKNLR